MESIEDISRQLNGFLSQIKICFDDSDWEKLSEVLTARQLYLEHMLSTPVEDEFREPVRLLLQGVLQQDKECLEKILEQKNKLIELYALFEHGQQAVKAYSRQ